jgi:hypothetical protein
MELHDIVLIMLVIGEGCGIIALFLYGVNMEDRIHLIKQLILTNHPGLINDAACGKIHHNAAELIIGHKLK